MPRLLACVLGGLLLISMTGLAIIYWVIQASKDTLPYEIAKAFIQLAVVATAGALTSVVVFEYQRERQRGDQAQENERLEARRNEEKMQQKRDADLAETRRRIAYRDELLKSIMTRAVESYNSVKKTRRLLEARAKFLHVPVSFGQGGAASEPQERIARGEYDKYVEIIIDAQLEFETIKRDVETPGNAMTQQALVSDQLRKMEVYLNELIKEYKKKRREFRSSDESLELDSLPKLKAFLPISQGGSFDRLSGPMHDIQRTIRQELLQPILPDPAPPAPRARG